MGFDLANLFSVALGAILVNNFIFSQFLGICPFLGVSKKLDSAVGMSLAVTFVMVLATAATWPIQMFLLTPASGAWDLGYLQTIVFILIIAILVQLLESILKKYIPALYKSLGVYLPLITTNCTILGVTILNIDQGYEYYDLALAVTEELGVTDQVLIKGKRPAEVVAAKFAAYPHNMMYMPVIDILKPQGRELFEEYRKSEKQPLAYEVCWDEYTPEVEACMKRIADGGSKLWVNSLWPSLCGGLNDDRAFRGETEEVYGRLLDMGATIIQTDRPELLIRYLESKGRRG